MYLKSLTLKGFKSFAQTTTVDLGPGLSVVVGPNGSGKSNIVDAIAWVLGSQAPTALRSQQMDDVIFAGNPGRPALGRAEVTLTLDNEDRRLPLDFDEVAISRTLFRSGDSSYAINAAPARLIDIAEMLAAAGVGRHRHVIVSQGRIDAVLNAKPAERRAVLEEAAGVSAYRQRKERALRRLADTEANLERLADQLSEVRRALRPLEQQAETARRHGALATELASLQIHRLGAELSGLRARRREAATQRRDLADRRAAAGREMAALDGRIADAEARLSAAGHVTLVEATERLGVLRDRVLGAQRAVEERRRDYESRRRDRLASDLLVALSDEAAGIEAALVEAGAAEAELGPERDAVAAATSALAADTEAHAARWESPGGAGDPSAAARLQGRLATLRDVAERAEAEVDRLEERSRLIDERREAAAAALERATGEVEARRLEEAAAGEALEAAEARRREAAGAESAARSAHGDAAAEHARWRSRVDALALAMGDVRARSGMEVLAGSDGVLGALGDLVAVDDGWEAAFEAAAGEALAAAVVDGPDAARPALEALARAQVAGAVLPAHRSGAEPPPVGEPLRPHVRARRRGVRRGPRRPHRRGGGGGELARGVRRPGRPPRRHRRHARRRLLLPDRLAGGRRPLRRHRRGSGGVARWPRAGRELARRGRPGGGRGRLRGRRRGQGPRRGVHGAPRLRPATGRGPPAGGSRRAHAQRRGGRGRGGPRPPRRGGGASPPEPRPRRRGGCAAGGTHRGRRGERRVGGGGTGRTRRPPGRPGRRAPLLEVRASEIRTRRRLLADRLEEIGARLAGHEAAVAASGADARRSAALSDLAERLAASAAVCQSGLEELRSGSAVPPRR